MRSEKAVGGVPGMILTRVQRTSLFFKRPVKSAAAAASALLESWAFHVRIVTPALLRCQRQPALAGLLGLPPALAGGSRKTGGILEPASAGLLDLGFSRSERHAMAKAVVREARLKPAPAKSLVHPVPPAKAGGRRPKPTEVGSYTAAASHFGGMRRAVRLGSPCRFAKNVLVGTMCGVNVPLHRCTRCLPLLAIILTALVTTTGCDMLDMYDEPRFEPLEASTFFDDGTSARPLVAGTVARGDLRDDEALYTGKVDGKYVTELPVELDRALLVRGQERFNIYCSPCHGRVGDGNGMIVQRGFRRPPSFVSTDRLLHAPVGHFYDVISNGFGAMPSYASRVEPRDRWAIVAYIRALQRSQNGSLDDVPAEKRDNIVEREGVQAAEQEKREAAEKLDVERQRQLQRDIREHRRSPDEGERRREEIERERSGESDLKRNDKETRRQGDQGRARVSNPTRPHPACLDGEEGGWLVGKSGRFNDPRLVSRRAASEADHRLSNSRGRILFTIQVGGPV